ncbi:Protein NUCLEAR FUSION DEFECTIVE 6 like [Actinidia chinensis var. chinensis]|uniref:Protein NUCLEAR FUSION DEFECTIVE 6 like n=1 Tax=Actinidia chinensis var. chinensis TaxID=1590841 RepID=A0A2R6Q3E2_ACTCC|nr:Protein NUCLEAR FUSION DEFECTIVE 6 like [Actinidia chinensis var. chinensis]
MFASTVARRSINLRTTLLRTVNSVNTISRPSSLPNLSLRHGRNALLSRLRRESVFLSSLLPLHSAIASACLVSKLPSQLSTSEEGRFTNYVSPI